MLKRIERAKDVQIFNLEKNLIQKSHVGKHATYVQYKINICFHVCMQYAVNFMWKAVYITLDTVEANQELQSINEQLQHKLATMLQISNAKDWQIAQLEYKLRSQLMMLSSQSDYQENSKGMHMLSCIYLIILIA